VPNYLPDPQNLHRQSKTHRHVRYSSQYPFLAGRPGAASGSQYLIVPSITWEQKLRICFATSFGDNGVDAVSDLMVL